MAGGKVALLVVLLIAAASAPRSWAQSCDRPPQHSGPAWAGGAYGQTSDSHTYNPYSANNYLDEGPDHESKQPGETGSWATDSFVITCSSSTDAFMKANLTAFIANRQGDPACRGGILNISNGGLHPVYFGLNGVLNNKLEAHANTTLDLPLLRAPNDPRPTRQEITVKYWVDGHGPPAVQPSDGTPCGSYLEFFRAIEHSSRVFHTNRKRLQWSVDTTINFEAVPPRPVPFVVNLRRSVALVDFDEQLSNTTTSSHGALIAHNNNPSPVLVIVNDEPYSLTGNSSRELFSGSGGGDEANCPCPTGSWTASSFHVQVSTAPALSK